MKSQFKGTPGKWKVGKTPHAYEKFSIVVRYYVFADVLKKDERKRNDRFVYNQILRPHDDKEIHNEAYYNSCLIAAAPELLEALITAQQQLAIFRGRLTNEKQILGVTMTIDLATEAIKKATGQI